MKKRIAPSTIPIPRSITESVLASERTRERFPVPMDFPISTAETDEIATMITFMY